MSIDNRLSACASLVRHGSLVADIGSDHAYLPIYLIENGICPRAIASDINEGPVARARQNVSDAGLEKLITVMLADGLDSASKSAPDDIIIAGMGGELIRDILSRSEYVKDPGVRLILQPMTMPEVLRTYLYEHGFAVTDELICRSAGKNYQIIAAAYDGVPRKISYELSVIGEINSKRIAEKPTESDVLYINTLETALKRRIVGMKSAETPDTAAISRDISLIEYIAKLRGGIIKN